MTVQIGNYKVRIQAEDRIFSDMPKAEATKHFLNELSIVFDKAAGYMDAQTDLSEDIRATVAGVYRRISDEIFNTLDRKGFYGDEKHII